MKYPYKEKLADGGYLLYLGPDTTDGTIPVPREPGQGYKASEINWNVIYYPPYKPLRINKL